MARHTKIEAQLTRTRIVEAALAAFAEHGVRATSLGDVATRADVTRGAVYWHFADKPALVCEVIAGLEWPLDIGADIEAYGAHPQPLLLLRRQLWRQMERCVQTPWQWQRVKLVLRHGIRSELSPAPVAQLEELMARTVQRLGQVMAIAHGRGQLRDGLAPPSVAQGLHAVGKAMLAEHASEPAHSQRPVSPLCLELFMKGAAAEAVQMAPAPSLRLR
ncbi:TetR family transcriptional regulator [Variovorax sp. YR566]|uniref:TetR family transcriptional regulator n=1 Tax=Variovorax sp. YR566 TaxID=3450237 RepID=UPI003F80589C